MNNKPREFVAISTADEFVICIDFGNGNIVKAYERRRISDREVEVIQHRNRDRNGNYYTTRHVYRDAVCNPDIERR